MLTRIDSLRDPIRPPQEFAGFSSDLGMRSWVVGGVRLEYAELIYGELRLAPFCDSQIAKETAGTKVTPRRRQ